jgi:hypothetical protein
MMWIAADAAPPARGAAWSEVIVATAVGLAGLLAWLGLMSLYHWGRLPPLSAAVKRAARAGGMPSWVALPALVAAVSLVSAVFGFYWDVSTHIDNGRDPGPFANPSHYFILAGLAGIALAGHLSAMIARSPDAGRVTSAGRRRVPVGAALLMVCGLIAVAGFPLDDMWHRLFGQDVTLWGPTHIQMIGGASLSTLALWTLVREGTLGDRPGRRSRGQGVREALLAGAFLIGLSTLQAEFDFLVPQFRMEFQPVLIMLAAGIGLVTARVVLGRGGALAAVAVFLVIRAGLALGIGVGLGRTMPHFPLYLGEALAVEAVASLVGRERQLTLGLWSGLAIGTVGLASEWAWSHVWMPLPWTSALLPGGAVLAFVAALAGGVLGGLIGRALAPPSVERQRFPLWAPPVAAVAIIAVLAIPLRQSPPPDISARVTLTETDRGPGRWVHATIHLEPNVAPRDSRWFHVMAWQGLEWRRGTSRVAALDPIGPGRYRTTEPVPVSGDWKTLLRLHRDDWIAAVPIYLPEDPAIPAEEIPASRTFERPFVSDRQLLQREAVGGSPGLWTAASVVLLLIAGVWIGAMTWGLQRLDGAARARAGTAAEPKGATAGRPRPRTAARPGSNRG